jgi:hypothetical protein
MLDMENVVLIKRTEKELHSAWWELDNILVGFGYNIKKTKGVISTYCSATIYQVYGS